MRKALVFATIFFIIIFLVLLVLFVFNSQKKESLPEADKGRTLVLLGADNPEADSVSIKTTRRQRSVISNESFSYSIEVPNSWRVETQHEAMKLYPQGEGVEQCLFNIVVYTDDFPEIKDREILTNHGRINTVVKDIQINNHQGKLATTYEDMKIGNEVIYLENNNYLYGLVSYYKDIHSDGEMITADYETCHQVFESLVKTFSFN